ncbi:hypothetical protein [Oribacterium sp. FC2011]|uniref:hypothetical protein n=1 Tax=Oribacterium sp. FC2011 TaxID=1408311 RepID=UPI0005D2C26A|nr:hypothetical protein [Oribacterium sp. FC2011]
MFCKWCGKKITNNGAACPHCGREQIPLVNGNGFWDLCDSKPTETNGIKPTEIKGIKPTETNGIKPIETSKIKPVQTNVISPRKKEYIKVEHNLDKKNMKDNRSTGPLPVLTMILALISLIVSISCFAGLNRIKDLQEDIDGLRKKITSQSPEQTFEISGSEERLDGRNSDIDELEEVINRKFSELNERQEKLEHEIAELKAKSISDGDNIGNKQNVKKPESPDKTNDRNYGMATDSMVHNNNVNKNRS